jgi:hypothetical protein
MFNLTFLHLNEIWGFGGFGEQDVTEPAPYKKPVTYCCGDVIAFIMKMDHITFTETIERLAERIGYTLRYDESGNSDRRVLIAHV